MDHWKQEEKPIVRRKQGKKEEFDELDDLMGFGDKKEGN
eukprot:CAMPEP_0202968710 /NCGR_PEP_ID=MMETSP1396-20130829/14118_1 /ASSEMBLY_ACC=CAM_ASM_000872 /TAXON_ID= /ORGANISM="Pseudokeronopsis sp., Strain Brazil" /LENGTH=38 /DNA_ID= /DNA_START= /DNA_END= /DNA_ORIENTATION=